MRGARADIPCLLAALALAGGPRAAGAAAAMQPVAAEIESCRPFPITGQVAASGQYRYVSKMSVGSAVAITGGCSPRAQRDDITLPNPQGPGASRIVVSLGFALSSGGTALVDKFGL
jgi:polysaccharide export outer membrane protein